MRNMLALEYLLSLVHSFACSFITYLLASFIPLYYPYDEIEYMELLIQCLANNKGQINVSALSFISSIF